jgi:hypothetical protein
MQVQFSDSSFSMAVNMKKLKTTESNTEDNDSEEEV